MNNPAGSLAVSVAETIVVIKVAGRASFTISADFKRLILELIQRGYRRFLIDLSKCLILDSTFLGVLAAAGQKLSGKADPAVTGSVELFRANERVVDLLNNLGVASLFTFVSETDRLPQLTVAAQSVVIQASREETSRTCLEAHLTLMNINPANVPRFKDVTKFIAEDLEKIQSQKR